MSKRFLNIQYFLNICFCDLVRKTLFFDTIKKRLYTIIFLHFSNIALMPKEDDFILRLLWYVVIIGLFRKRAINEIMNSEKVNGLK